MIECQHITTLESDGNYIRVMEAGDPLPSLIRGTLQSVCEVLDPDMFVRISRSAVVNLTHVDRIERDADSHLLFVMRDSGRRLNVGRTFHPHIVQRLKL